MASKNINKEGIKTTLENCMDYIGPSSTNAYLLRIVKGDRDEYGERAETIAKTPIFIYLGRQNTTVEMSPGAGNQHGKINFSVKVETDLDESDLIEMDDIVYIVDVIKPVTIGDGKVIKVGLLIRRRDDA